MSAGTDAATSPAAKPRGGGLNIVLVALLLIQLAAAGGLGGWAILGQSAGGATDAPSGSAPAIAPEPGPLPPVPEVTWSAATPSDATAGSHAPERISAVVESLGQQLSALPLDAAPPHLVVLGSGQQTVEKITEIPRHERWELQFPPGNSVESYARQLEYFHIELGLIGGSDQIAYVTNLADPTPKSRTGPAGAENRLYLVWQRGSMQAADEQLISKAKLPIADRIVAHFCPPDLESQLVQLEDAAAKGAGLNRIRKTVFAIRANEFGGYRLHVLEQKGD
jgi:hypothetical protein